MFMGRGLYMVISHVPRRDKARQGDWGRASTSGTGRLRFWPHSYRHRHRRRLIYSCNFAARNDCLYRRPAAHTNPEPLP